MESVLWSNVSFGSLDLAKADTRPPPDFPVGYVRKFSFCLRWFDISFMLLATKCVLIHWGILENQAGSWSTIRVSKGHRRTGNSKEEMKFRHSKAWTGWGEVWMVLGKIQAILDLGRIGAIWMVLGTEGAILAPGPWWSTSTFPSVKWGQWSSPQLSL